MERGGIKRSARAASKSPHRAEDTRLRGESMVKYFYWVRVENAVVAELGPSGPSGPSGPRPRATLRRP
ncbi:MAG: hypothetical protein Q9211_002636 [Gyalolechia sp. 1 TL-2023]